MLLGTEVCLGLGDIVLDGNRARPTELGTTAPTSRPLSIVAKRSPISGTVELLIYYILVSLLHSIALFACCMETQS